MSTLVSRTSTLLAKTQTSNPLAANAPGHDQERDPERLFIVQSGAGGTGNDAIVETGSDGDDGLAGGVDDDILFGAGGNDTIHGHDGDDILSGGAGNDVLFGNAGVDSMIGGAGNDFGLISENGDSFVGSDGIDTAGVQGNYSGLLDIDATTEVVLVASGADTRFGDTANNRYDYAIAIPAIFSPVLTIQAEGLRAGEDIIVIGSVYQGALRVFVGAGTATVTGGVGMDGFFVGAPAFWNPFNKFFGGDGIDSIAFRGNYIGPRAIFFAEDNFFNVEVVALLSGLDKTYGGFIVPEGFDYSLTMADGNVAAGRVLDINGNRLGAMESVDVDASAELDGAYRFFLGAGDDHVLGSAGADLLFGNLGADILDGGPGSDTYSYLGIAESTVASYDTIAFAAGDRIDLSRIDAIAATINPNDAFTFIGTAAFNGIAGQLRVAGGFILGDTDGNGVADLVIAFTGSAPTAADFIL